MNASLLALAKSVNNTIFRREALTYTLKAKREKERKKKALGVIWIAFLVDAILGIGEKSLVKNVINNGNETGWND